MVMVGLDKFTEKAFLKLSHSWRRCFGHFHFGLTHTQHGCCINSEIIVKINLQVDIITFFLKIIKIIN